MKKDSRDRRFKVCACRSAGRSACRPAGAGGLRFKTMPLTKNEYFSKVSKGFLLVVMLSVVFSLLLGCQKKEKAPPAPPAVKQKAIEPGPILAGEPKAPEAPVQGQGFTFYSILTKNLDRPDQAATFSKNDRIYLLTVWTGLQGPHEIKVLWIRPDKTVQETVRLKENISSKPPTYTSWAYLSFTKGLLNISPMEGKFIGAWKAQLYLDGKLLKEYDFSVF